MVPRLNAIDTRSDFRFDTQQVKIQDLNWHSRIQIWLKCEHLVFLPLRAVWLVLRRSRQSCQLLQDNYIASMSKLRTKYCALLAIDRNINLRCSLSVFLVKLCNFWSNFWSSQLGSAMGSTLPELQRSGVCIKMLRILPKNQIIKSPNVDQGKQKAEDLTEHQLHVFYLPWQAAWALA